MNLTETRTSHAHPEKRLRQLYATLTLLLLVLGSGCASSQPQDAEDKYREGLSRANSDTQGAMKIFEEGLTTYPNHHRMRFALARLQHDTGETQHLESLRLRHVSRKLDEEGKAADSEKAKRESADARGRATPFYRAARENLQIVAKNDNDDVRRAWAFYVLAKCDVFFDDYEASVDHLEKAIDVGKPQGQQLAQWQEMLTTLKRDAKRGGAKPK